MPQARSALPVIRLTRAVPSILFVHGCVKDEAGVMVQRGISGPQDWDKEILNGLPILIAMLKTTIYANNDELGCGGGDVGLCFEQIVG